jgi:acyl-coenzyme A synthetase/AMP-(fatty) acid ligase
MSFYSAQNPSLFSKLNLFPGVNIEIVNDNDEPLLNGNEGVIRVKTSGMSDGYLNNPEATQSHFKNGWFYPGDRGQIDEKGRLILMGRSSEIVNIGGVKIAAHLLDDHAKSHPDIKDAAAFTFIDKFGAEAVGIAIVTSNKIDMGEFANFFAKGIDKKLVPQRILSLRKIPRNSMGKVVRHQLAAFLEKQEATLSKNTSTNSSTD